MILTNLPESEVLAQLAEESAELAKAALKLRRVLEKTNPTPVTEANARANLAEEVNDVMVCLLDLGIEGDRDFMQKKMCRWVSRLKHGTGGEQHG